MLRKFTLFIGPNVISNAPIERLSIHQYFVFHRGNSELPVGVGGGPPCAEPQASDTTRCGPEPGHQARPAAGAG